MINQKNQWMIRISLFVIFFLAVLHSAWLSDDSFITLRTVLNFLHGYGPVFNIDERVQAYTHPLWFLILSGAAWLSPYIFATTFCVAIIISCITFWLFLTRIPVNFWMGVIAALGLILSKAYIDFSTSGLENPLSHLLVLCLVLCAIHKRIRTYFFLCGLLYLTRVDLCLIVLPLSLFLFFKPRDSLATKLQKPVSRDVRTMDGRELKGMDAWSQETSSAAEPKWFLNLIILITLPILWTLFSLYYYGLSFPNTAYAKLHTGISHFQYFYQGLLYLLDSLRRDPITLCVIVTGIITGFSNDTLCRRLSYGILLYLLYIFYIGGDFMSGRFLTTPLLLASIQIARLPWKKTTFRFIACSVLLLGGVNISSTLLSPLSYKVAKFHYGIADERGYYFQRYGLLTAPYRLFIRPNWVERKPRILFQKCGGLGTYGLSAGPSAFIIDICGLTDPLLSHLPIEKKKRHWRIGHFRRAIPEGYVNSIIHNQNVIVDPQLHAYYDNIRLITRGELNDPRRLQEIIRFNFDQ